jgi:hypothetical protein
MTSTIGLLGEHRANGEVRSRAEGDGYLLFYARTRKMYLLSGLGWQLWMHAGDTKKCEDILRSSLLEDGDALPFVLHLLKEGLLVPTGAPGPRRS